MDPDEPSTSISSFGVIDKEPTQIYGTGRIVIRIGNGGAGATGLIQALANDYLSTRPAGEAVSWVCNHSRNTQLALLHNYIDLALTYERDQESLAASEGWSVTAGCVFHDHFCLAGPSSDPAHIRSCSSLQEALLKISEARALFHSRNDDSATMWKERGLWSANCGLSPWEGTAGAADWYKMSVCSPAEALEKADAAGAYLLTDRSTLLRQTALKTIARSTVFFEPSAENDVLMNSCFALYSPSRSLAVSASVRSFLEYLRSARGQKVIGSFGESVVGVPFFASVDQGFARTKLRDGTPKNGRWVLDCGV